MPETGFEGTTPIQGKNSAETGNDEKTVLNQEGRARETPT